MFVVAVLVVVVVWYRFRDKKQAQVETLEGKQIYTSQDTLGICISYVNMRVLIGKYPMHWCIYIYIDIMAFTCEYIYSICYTIDR